MLYSIFCVISTRQKMKLNLISLYYVFPDFFMSMIGSILEIGVRNLLDFSFAK